MSNNYKNKVLTKAKQNRTNRVVSTNKKYKNDISKSQQAYIAGDLISSASKKAYGYKQNGVPEQSWITGGRSRSNYQKLQEGKNPYESKYYYDGKARTVTNSDGSTFTSKKRYLTDDEKEALKYTGDINVSNYKKNYKYSWLDGVDSDGKTYNSHFNLLDKNGKMKWDGMNVAKNKVKAGGSKLNYLGGFLKDTVVDAGVDFLKLFDKYESGAMGAGLGIAETTKDVVDSITSGDLSFDNVDWSRAKKNWDESIEEANKTGWGHSAMHYLKEMSNRSDDKMYNYLLETKGKESADKYKESEQKVQGVENVANTVLGLGFDFMNPAQIGTAFAKTLGKAGKLTAQSGKALLNGSSDISTAFKVDPLKTQAMIDKFASRVGKTSSKGDEVLNTLTGQGKIDEGILGNSLNKQFDYAMSKAEDVKQVVKSNPKTQNLGSFLDEIGENIPKGTQRNIDGRTLNKKYTQVKDGYTPQLLRGEEVVDDIAKNVDNAQINFGQYNNSNINNYFKDLRQTDEGVYIASELKYASDTGDYSNLINSLDDIDPKIADRVIDWLEEYEPNVFNKHFGGLSDEFDEFTNEGILSNKLSQKRDSALVNNVNKNSRKIVEKPKYDHIKTNNVREENAIEKIASLFDEKTPKKYANNYERKYAFENSIRNLSKDMFSGKVDGDDIVKSIQDVKGNNVPTNIKREYINNKLFGGDEVIASNVGSKSMDGLLDSVEDLANLKKVVSHYMETGEVLPVKLSESTKDFLKVGDDLKVIGDSVRGNKIHDPEELVETLNKSIVDRARALTDERYGDKLQLMARELGYDNYNSEILDTIDKLKAQRKALDKVPNKTAEIMDEQRNLSKRIKELTNIKSTREDMWNKLKNLPEKDFDKLISEQYPHYMKDLNSYKPKTNQYKEIQNLSKGDGIEDVRNMEIDNALEKGFGGDRKTFNDIAPKVDDEVEEVSRKLSSVEVAENLNKHYQELGEFAKKIGVSVPKKTQAKVKLTKGQTLGSLPPVKENLNNLKSLIKKEVEEMLLNPKGYEESKRLYSSLKKEYINGLRSYGVPDNAYFEKATNLRKSLIDDLEKQGHKLFEKSSSVEKPIDLVRQAERDELLKSTKYKELSDEEIFNRKLNKSKEGGSGTPKNGMNMNLQLLARKIDEMFDELGNTSIEKLSKNTSLTHLKGSESVSNNPVDKLINNTSKTSDNPLDEFVNGFDEFNQLENAKSTSKLQEETVKSTSKKSQKPSNEEIDKILERYKDYGNGKSFDDVDEFNSFRDSFDGKTQKEIDKFIQSNDPTKQSTFEKFKKFFTEKSEDAQIGYEEDGIYKAYKAWLNTYKKGLTIYNPGWHVANFLQNKGQNYLALGSDAFGSQKNARKVLAHINGKDKGALELVTKNGDKYTKEELAKLAKDLGVAEGLGTNTSKSHGVFPWLETKIDNSRMMQGALQSEQTARLHHFLTQLERGKTPEQAVKSVNDYLFDYGSKTKADKLMSDFVDPFWSFHKSNAKMLVQAPFKNTSNVNNVLRVNRDLKNTVDDENKNSPMYREHQLPFGSFKDELNGDEYNYLYDENVLPDIDKAIPLEREDVETKLNPLIRIALQQSRGEGEFGNKIVDKDEADWGEVTKDERLKEIGLELNPVLNPFFKKFDKTANHQKKTDEGKQTQETTNKQVLNEWLAYILGNKGNYYRNMR